MLTDEERRRLLEMHNPGMTGNVLQDGEVLRVPVSLRDDARRLSDEERRQLDEDLAPHLANQAYEAMCQQACQDSGGIYAPARDEADATSDAEVSRLTDAAESAYESMCRKTCEDSGGFYSRTTHPV